jgi:hypothetical protein
MKAFLAALLATVVSMPLGAADLPEVEVYKSPYCSCCTEWEKHVRDHGFRVKSVNIDDVPGRRARLGMPERYGSCHTAKVGSYLIEGHVPAVDVQRLLREKPKAVGLAAPGMPGGSPGMESAPKEPYDVLLIGSDGKAKVFARH